MERAFHLLNELRNIVEGNPRLYLPEVPGRNLERLPAGRAALARQSATQHFIYNLSERASGAAGFRLQLGRYVIIQG
jgi:hypothetical protein